jgi:hypothetical protein
VVARGMAGTHPLGRPPTNFPALGCCFGRRTLATHRPNFFRICFQHPALLLALFIVAAEPGANADPGFGDSCIGIEVDIRVKGHPSTTLNAVSMPPS